MVLGLRAVELNLVRWMLLLSQEREARRLFQICRETKISNSKWTNAEARRSCFMVYKTIFVELHQCHNHLYFR